MTELMISTDQKRLWVGILAGFSVLLSAYLAQTNHARQWLFPRDDQMYTLSVAARKADGAEPAPLLGRVAEFVESKGTPSARLRYHLREEYRQNYLAFTLAMAAASRVLQGSLSPTSETFPRFAAVTMAIGFRLLPSVLALALAGLAVWLAVGAGRLDLAMGVVLSSAYFALETVLPFPTSVALIPHMADVVDSEWLFALRHIGYMLLDGGASVTPFGVTTRSAIFPAILIIFVLRWAGRTGLAYWVLFALALLHQSMAGLAVPFVVACDLVTRPAIFRRPAVFMPVAAAVGVFVAREDLITFLNLESLLYAAAALAVLIGLAGTLLRPAPALRWLDGIRERLAASSQVGTDLVVLSVVWMGVFVASWIGNSWLATFESSTYFWQVLGGRSLGMIRPVLIAGVSAFVWLFLVRWLNSRAASLLAAFGLAAGLQGVALAQVLIGGCDTVERNQVLMRQYEAQLQEPLERFGTEHEALIYYALAKSVFLNRDFASQLTTGGI